MTELTIRPEEIRDAIERNVAAYSPGTAREEVGRVTQTGDGIARVEGLHSAMTNELLEFEGGLLGLALNLDIREIGVVLLGDGSHIEEGQAVRRTGEVLSVPVGDGFLGRVVDPVGNPIDGLGPIEAEGRRPLEVQAPTVVQRQPVKEPMQTGIKAIDAMTAIGRGQRQLIIGDRQTGKTAVCLDTILNQRENWLTGDPNKQVRCIYVAIGQKGSTIASVKGARSRSTALWSTRPSSPRRHRIPPASSTSPPTRVRPSASTGCTPASTSSSCSTTCPSRREAYRAVSLLLRRPPGREAYPGDVFYLHSRLLERCAKLSDELGGGFDDGPANHRDEGQ